MNKLEKQIILLGRKSQKPIYGVWRSGATILADNRDRVNPVYGTYITLAKTFDHPNLRSPPTFKPVVFQLYLFLKSDEFQNQERMTEFRMWQTVEFNKQLGREVQYVNQIWHEKDNPKNEVMPNVKINIDKAKKLLTYVRW